MNASNAVTKTETIADGLCGCGCGQVTGVYEATRPKRGQFRGQPKRFINTHHARVADQRGSNNPSWKGGRRRRGSYWIAYAPGHPRAHNNYVYEHILIAEKALGRYLPVGCDVHHVDEDKLNNAPGNLVICEDSAYHHLLHRRQRALDECGDANAIRCHLCGRYDRQDEIVVRPGVAGRFWQSTHHQSCKLREAERRRAATKAFYPGKSQYRGVGRGTSPGTFRVWIGDDCLGHFRSEIEAAQAYDHAARARYGSRARLNFPS